MLERKNRPSRRYESYTREQIERMRDLYVVKGYTAAQVCAMLNFPSDRLASVASTLSAIKRGSRKYLDQRGERRARRERLVNEFLSDPTLTYAALARREGVCAGSIVMVLRREGVDKEVRAEIAEKIKV